MEVIMAENKDLIIKALNVITLLNTAIKNVRMYPPSSASVFNAHEKLYQALLDFFVTEEVFVFAESEKTLLICGSPLRQVDQEKPHILSLLNQLLDFGLKSISFGRGISKEELAHFIDFFSRKPESVKSDGGLDRLMADQNIVHITLDQKVYVAVGKDHQIFPSLDITDDQITQFFMLAHPEMDPDSPQFREMAKDPEAVSRAFDAGLSKIMEQQGVLTDVQISESLAHMLSLLDKTAGGLNDENRSTLSQHIGRALVTADPAIAEQLTTQNMAHLLGGFLLQFLMAELTPGKLGITDMPGSEASSTDTDAIDEAEKTKLLEVTEKFSLRLQNEKMLLDEDLMSALPKIIEQLIAYKEQEAMENLLERLAGNLTSKQDDIRLSAARNLADIIESLPGEQKRATVKKLSSRLIEWLKNEIIFSVEYKRICAILKDETQEGIAQKVYSEALTYLDAFQAVACATNGKPDDAKNTALEIIEQLASSENTAILRNEMDSTDKQKQAEAGRVFIALGPNALENQLKELRTSTNSDERVRIMRLIAFAKEKALPLITGLITKEAPWFYIRNLAYLLGQIGNEESARILAPLLSNRNHKLRLEALKSIHKTGGRQRGNILLAALSLAEEEFKPSIVEALGQCKALEAVPVLLDLLRDKPLIASSARTSLEEKICAALGSIGSPDAIGPLAEIAEAKSFLKRRAYPEKVKAAASGSLVILRDKHR